LYELRPGTSPCEEPPREKEGFSVYVQLDTVSNSKWRHLTRAKLLPATETLFFHNLITFNVLALHVYENVATDQRN